MPLLAHDLDTTDLQLARGSYYAATAQRDARHPALQGDTACDVAVVGGGLAGLSAALDLRRKGFDVVLLEARSDVGAGTSKANTAILHTGFDATPGSLESRLVARGWHLVLAEPQPEFLSIVPYTSEVKEPRLRLKAMPAEVRNKSYIEYEIPYTQAEAMAECGRIRENAQAEAESITAGCQADWNEFLRQAELVRRYGAAVIVMAFDEQGQADTLERKIAICERAYRLLVDEVGFPPEDIIFDPNIFAVGDLAALNGPDGRNYPGVAQVAMQEGRRAGANIRLRLAEQPTVAFHYQDKGNLATIGRNRAIAEIKGFRLAGFGAWLVWLWIHIFFLIGFQNRLRVAMQWAWSYLRFDRGARLITSTGYDRTKEIV